MKLLMISIYNVLESIQIQLDAIGHNEGFASLTLFKQLHNVYHLWVQEYKSNYLQNGLYTLLNSPFNFSKKWLIYSVEFTM